ncbi:thiamine pyrophosphate-binding protein [Austwickia chelonae]|uniref:thiamine pyrophosphate-binding protein n=1 Tax=Austwickia chelonae TaxID=100225 RepID=UPI000E2485D4|nr:thiamine pyrophosphate-binding protein [Austwickia chelonae]
MAEKEHATTEARDIPTSQLRTRGRTGGDLLVSMMRDAGVEVAFGVISIHNIPLVEAVDRDLRFVPVRHEAAAINAADGYARATGRIGVALTSTGTGAGNAAGAMLEALTAQSRVLHITGNVASTVLGDDRGIYHEVPRQLEMLDAVSGMALRIDRADHARRVLAEALQRLSTPPHLPVSIDWPIDLQYTADPTDQETIQQSPARPDPPTAQEITAAAELLRTAQRPLIWAGGGARRVGPALTELARVWGAGVLTGANGRGSISEDHPSYIGNFAATEAVRPLVEEADCLLTVGSHLRGHETDDFGLPLPSTHVQIDLDTDAIGRNYPVIRGIVADANSVIPSLLDDMGRPNTQESWIGKIRNAAEAARAAHREDIGAYAAICDAMSSKLPRESPRVRDVTIPGSTWGNRLLPIYDPTTNVFAAGGGIGQGLAMAIGAAVACPQLPVLAMIGDGGLAVHLGELCTLAGERPQVILVLFNDSGYGVLRHMQTAQDAPPRGVDLYTPDFAKLSASLDLPHVRVGDPAAFDAALTVALARTGPSIIEIDVPALRPRPKPFVPPVDVP